MEQDIREVFIKGFTGDNRQGKSVEAVRIALEWKKHNTTGTIIAFDPQNRFAFADHIITIEDEDWAEVIAERTHVLLILDDFSELHPSMNETAGIKKLLAKRANNGIDIMYICHNPGDILNAFTKRTSEYYIFYTNSTIAKIKEKIPNNPQLFLDGVEYINKYTGHFGTHTYPGPFAYVVCNIKTNKLTAVNFKHRL